MGRFQPVSARKWPRAAVYAAAISATGLAACLIAMPSAARMPAFGSAEPASSVAPLAHRASTSTGPGRTIVVAEGETLISIARRYGVPMSALLDHNTLRSVALEPGTQLFVPELPPGYRLWN